VWDAAEILDQVNVGVEKARLVFTHVRSGVGCLAVWQSRAEQHDAGRLAVEDDIGLAPVDLNFGARRMVDRDEDLLPVDFTTKLFDKITDSPALALKAMLISQSLENPHGGVPLFSVPLQVFGEPLTDDRNVGLEFRALARDRLRVADRCGRLERFSDRLT